MNIPLEFDAWRDGPVFDRGDIERAATGIEALGKYPVLDATIRFRNALQACLRDLDRAQDAIPPAKILAADATEIFCLIGGAGRHERNLSNFTFGGLVSGDTEGDQEFARLDQLLTGNLLGKEGAPFLLLDPHAQELTNFGRHAHENLEAAAGPFRTAGFGQYSSEQRRRISEFLTQLHPDEGARQWQLFKRELLPDVSDILVEQLISRASEYNSFSEFIRKSPYCLVGPASLGAHSFEKIYSYSAKKEFPWDDYVSFTENETSKRRAHDIFENCETLLSKIRHVGGRASRRPDISAFANANDAKAFAIIDGLNRFFLAKGTRARVELISRSPSLHTLLGVLPDGALNLTLRHPLLVPDIYGFDRPALSRLSEALLRVDTLLASAVDLKTGGFSSLVQSTFDDEYLHQPVREAAREAALLLRDRLIVRQTVQTTIGHGAIKFESVKGDEANPVSQLASFFDTIERMESAGEDVFSADLMPSLARRNLSIVALSAGRVFSGVEPSTLRLRVIDLFDTRSNPDLREGSTPKPTREPHPVGQVMPDQFMLVRATGGRFTREFHIHSGRIAHFVRTSISKKQDPTHPTLALVPVSEIVGDFLSSAFSALERDPQPDDVVFNLDATLLAGMAFAHRGHFDTAIALASTMLHRMTGGIRRQEERGFGKEQLRERLAYRELFLFRHYCERALARMDFFSISKRTADSKGSILRNLARAQRDLDFAALMSEDAERCVTQSAEASPAGAALINDGRLRLAHIGSWIEHFIMNREIAARSSVNGSADWLRERAYQDRLDTFTAAGLVKEIAILAHQMRPQANVQAPNSVGADNRPPKLSRYLAHIEVRALQSALTLFAVFLAYPVVPSLHRLWMGDQTLEPERVLVFRDWYRWYSRFNELVDQFGFEIRLAALINTVCETLLAAAAATKGTTRSREFDQEAVDGVLAAAMDRMDGILTAVRDAHSQSSDQTERGSTFVEVLGSAILYRLDELRGRNLR